MINVINFKIPNTQHGIKIILEEPAKIVGEEVIVTLPNHLFDTFVEAYKEYRYELNGTS